MSDNICVQKWVLTYINLRFGGSKGGISLTFQTICIIKSLRCKQSRWEWFAMKCFIVEKLTASDFFTVVVIGTRSPDVFYVMFIMYFSMF